MADNSVLVFTPSARRAQVERCSAKAYERRTAAGFPDRVTPELAEFLTDIVTAFLGTVSAAGAPYIQHRGGPKGFIKVVDERTLGFADYRGNWEPNVWMIFPAEIKWTLDGKPLADLHTTFFRSNPYIVFPIPNNIKPK